MRPFLRLLPISLLLSAPIAAKADLRTWLEEHLFEPIKLSGSKRIGYHLHEVSGDRASFDQQNYFGDGAKSFTDQTDLYVRGEKVLGFINFESRLTNSKFGSPHDRRLTFVYESKLLDAKLGDITGSLHNTNPLAGFSKTMRGAVGTLKLGKGYELKLVRSDTKATPRTITFPGANSRGPYYLPGGNIVDGTLRVRVDDVDKVLGVDYTVDYQTGTLTFSYIVLPTSTVQATYESYGFNDRSGSVMGASMLLPILSSLNVELTAVEQKTRAGSGLATRTERFYGYGDPSTPYDLQYEPLIDGAHPFFLTVDSVPQRVGIDYYFDQFLPFRFYFTRFIPSTSLVEAVYTPKPTSSAVTDGDKSIYGAAARWTPFHGASVQYNVASSKVRSAGGGSLEGLAQTGQFSYKVGSLGFKASFTDIPATYSAIASTGFRRNERGSQYDLSYDFGKGLSASAGYTTSRISSPTYNADGTVTDSPANNRLETLSLNYAPVSGPAVSFSHTKTTFRSATGETTNGADTLRVSRNFGTLSTSLELSRVRASRLSLTGSGQADNSTVDSVRLTTGWEAARWLSVAASAAQNRVAGTSGNTDGRDYSLDLNARFGENLTARLSFNDASSGYYNYSGYGSGYDYGYGTGGFSGGGSGYGTPTSGVRQRGVSLNVHYVPWNALSLDVTASKQMASGDYMSNSDLQTFSIGVGYTPTHWVRLTGSLTNQTVSFTSGIGSSNSTLYGLGLTAGPYRRWTLTLDYQGMLTGSRLVDSGFGSSSYDQNLNSYYARLTYDLGKRQRAFFDARSGSTFGYLASRELTWALGYEYDITRFASLVASYRVRDLRNLDDLNSAYSYRARSLDVDLVLRF